MVPTATLTAEMRGVENGGGGIGRTSIEYCRVGDSGGEGLRGVRVLELPLMSEFSETVFVPAV